MTLTLERPSFPPLLTGRAVAGDPFAAACAAAAEGCDAGLVLHRVMSDHLSAAIVFAPEVPLSQAMAMLPACGVGLQNALGALAPPEVGVHLGWDGAVLVNGGRCGALRAAALPTDPDTVPDWLVVGLSLVFMRNVDAPGKTPDETALYEEGCGDVDPMQLLESWTRHTLVWINRWSDDGPRPLHAEWAGLVPEIEKTVTRDGLTGTFLGVDDGFGMLMRLQDGGTRLFPLTALLPAAPLKEPLG